MQVAIAGYRVVMIIDADNLCLQLIEPLSSLIQLVTHFFVDLFLFFPLLSQ